MTHRVIFDTDPGVDDAMAIVFGHLHPEIELVGLTTVRGNASVALTTRNALHLVERFGIGCGVYRGADAALQVPTGPVPDFVHGEDGLGNTHPPAPRGQASGIDAAQFIVRTVRDNPKEITLVAVGRLTNLAHALELDPEIARLVRQVVVMGGALGKGGYSGNVSPCAEANIAGDPHAADRVFCAAWPVVMVGLDVTMQVVMDPERMIRIRDNSGDAGAFVFEVSRFYSDFYASKGYKDGFPVHDSSALAWLVVPDVYRLQRGALRAVTEGIAIGQTIQAPADSHFPPGAWDGCPIQKVAIDVDAIQVLDCYETTLRRAG
ncbi:MAG: nucleoside hydrolase [Pseudomonadota bacterium]